MKGGGRNPLVAQQIKDLALSQLWHRFVPWLGQGKKKKKEGAMDDFSEAAP